MAVFSFCSYISALNRYGCSFSSFVALWALVTNKHLLCLENLLAVVYFCCIRYRCQGTHFWMPHEKQQTISLQSKVREWAHVLLVNTRLHLYSFCAAGMSSGLAIRTTFTWVHGVGPASDLIFVPQYVIVVGLCCTWFALYFYIRVLCKLPASFLIAIDVWNSYITKPLYIGAVSVVLLILSQRYYDEWNLSE
jgi:hypothetical protein